MFNMNNSDNQKDEDASAAECSKLKVELESCRQKFYGLQSKVEVQAEVLKELYESNQRLEQELEKVSTEKSVELSALDKKYDASREEFNEHIAMQQYVMDDLLSQISSLEHELETRSKKANTSIKCESHVADNDRALLEKQIEELMSCVEEKIVLRQDAETRMNDLQMRNSELQDILETTEKHLRERNETLKTATEELVFLSAEEHKLKGTGDQKSDKGNSLFAEVEARRKQTANNFVAIKNDYQEAKQAYKVMVEEVRLLKTQRAAMEKWENDVFYSKADNEEILGKYKSRITDLENKLKAETKKNNESRVSSKIDSFNQYFESKLMSKNQEIENLQIRVKDLSIKLRVQEDAQLTVERQMRFWKCKASSLHEQTTQSEDAREKDRVTPKVKVKDENNSTSVNAAGNTLQNLSINEIEPMKKSLKFSEDTKDNTSTVKKTKGQDYPVVYIPG